MRCDWACAVKGGRWHAFERRPGANFNGETQLERAVCGVGPGIHPSAGIRHAPACLNCHRRTTQDGLFTRAA